MNQTWHTQTIETVLQELETSPQGLSAESVRNRQQTYGFNELKERTGKSPLRMLLEQFTETMVLILIAAAVVSALLGKATEAAAILAIVVLFAVLGFIQEYRAERAISAIKQLSTPNIRVRRSNEVMEIPARELVPGDVILLEAGNLVAADVRLLESANLRIQEAALTGESEPVEKRLDTVADPEVPLADRKNMGYLGTAVTYGRGTAVVVETGMRTELGKIASLIQDVPHMQTPLQKRLDQVGKSLAVAGVVAAALVLLVGFLRGEPLTDMFLTGISVAVAVVPEGLPAVVTITLALGAQRMLRQNALIRKLPAVETLGSVTVICSDKTGTLTENRMTVSVLDVAGERLDLTEQMSKTQMYVQEDECSKPQLLTARTPIQLVLAGSALCNDAVLKLDPESACYRSIGDPTEGAMVVAAAQGGMLKDELDRLLPRAAELPFDSNRKRMTTVHRMPSGAALPPIFTNLGEGGMVSFTKGAVDGMMPRVTRVWVNDRAEVITPEWRDRILQANLSLANNGMRVIGIGFRPLSEIPADLENALEQDLVFVGMVGMIDPPRQAVLPAVEKCLRAGIRPVMITGDHPVTAMAIARQLAITTGERSMTGDMLNQVSDDELQQVVGEVPVYARVSPEDKLRIVQALQCRGQVVAMTGDGVNDSPALKKADIGVAMGITGTDVAKEAADMVLLDDNFATIVAAVEEGRTIYDNLVRFVKFSLGGNLGKVLVMLAAPLLGINVALRPLQLLWLNLLTDGLMGLGLGTEPTEENTMRRPPRNPDANVLDRPVLAHVSWSGVLIAAITLALGAMYFDPAKPGDTTWQTMIFATLGFTQVGHALGLRASGTPVFSFRSNPLILAMTLATLALQLLVIYTPALERFFGLVPLAPVDLLTAFGFSILPFAGVRLESWLARRRNRPAGKN